MKWEFLEKNPCSIVQKMKVQDQEMDFWTLEEIQQYLGFWKNRPFQPRIFWPVLIALYTGLRRGELIGLKWDCVDLTARMITVKRTYCKVAQQIKEETKSKKIRKIPINQLLLHHLENLQRFTSASGYVLPFIHPDSYYKEFHKTSRQAGVRPIRFHDLRHTFASHFLMGKGDIYDLKNILGHSSVQVTEKYTHLVSTHLVGKTEILRY